MSYPTYQHEQPGLEAVRSDEAPEVVPDSQLRAPLERQSSLSRPEAYFQPQGEYQAEKAQPPRHSYYDQSKSPQLQNEQAKYGQPPGYRNDADKQVIDERSERRTCGMRRKIFWWMIAGIVSLVVIAAVLGGVLGSVLHKDSNSSSSSTPPTSPAPNATAPQRLDTLVNTGLTMVSPDNGASVWSYFEYTDGRIIENHYLDGQWAITDNDNITDKNVVAPSGAATQASPLAAIAYTLYGTAYRQVLFITSDGQLKTTQTNGNGTWSSPSDNILKGDKASTRSYALAACADTQSSGLNGIRVYYGSQNGYIQEVGMDFSESTESPIWHQWASFHGSDASSGVACALNGNKNHMYLRNTSTTAGFVQQWTWDYVHVTDWLLGTTSLNNFAMAPGFDIAVANDGAGTDHVFYQLVNGTVTRALSDGSAATLHDYEALDAQTAYGGTKLAAAYLDPTGGTAGAVLMYQNATNIENLYTVEITRSGVVTDNVINP